MVVVDPAACWRSLASAKVQRRSTERVSSLLQLFGFGASSQPAEILFTGHAFQLRGGRDDNVDAHGRRIGRSVDAVRCGSANRGDAKGGEGELRQPRRP